LCLLQRILGVLLFCYSGTLVYSGEVVQAFVEEQNGHFLLDLIMQIDAPKNKVLVVMTRYDRLNELSNSIRSSEILEQKKNLTRVKIINEGCILFICQTITQIQNVQQLDKDYLSIEVEPLEDNIKSSSQYWHFNAIKENKTRIHYSADIEPDFWIPTLFGSWLFQSRLLKEATEMINKAEKLANRPATSGYTVPVQ